MTKDARDNVTLSQGIFIDSIVAGFAGFALSWFITPMDGAVMEKMSGIKPSIQSSLKDSFKTILTKPIKYAKLPQFGYVFGTYSLSYVAKNYTDTVSYKYSFTPERTAFYKFWLVFAVNGGLSVFWKDPGLARIFRNTSKNSVAKSTPMAVYTSWIMRDSLHMIGAVVMPDYVEQKFGLTEQQWRYCQLSFPMFTQFITTPFHLMGLDYYNYQNNSDINSQTRIRLLSRIKRVGSNYFASVITRCARMFAPWSIGLLINRDLRNYLMLKVDS